MNNPSLRVTTLLLLFALFLGCSHAGAQEPEDEYLRIYTTIQQADADNKSGKAATALAKYRQALKALQDFQATHRTWNEKAVSFRISDVAEKINALTAAGAPQDASAGSNSGAQIKLIGAGAEPRKVLRFHPKQGTKQNVTLTIKMAMDMKMGEMESPGMKLPEIILPLDITVKSVTPQGDIHYEMIMGEPAVGEGADALGAVVEAMKSSMAGLKGITFNAIKSNRGFVRGIEVKVPPDASPQARQMMDQMKDSFANVATPLPEEAIGLGAKWEFKMPVKSQGMTIDQTASYELVSIEGERFNTKSTLTQKAANQKVQNPAMPAVQMDLKNMTGNGNADTAWDLAQVFPVDVALKVHSDFSMAMDMGGQKQPMEMKVDMNLKIESK